MIIFKQIQPYTASTVPSSKSISFSSSQKVKTSLGISSSKMNVTSTQHLFVLILLMFLSAIIIIILSSVAPFLVVGAAAAALLVGTVLIVLAVRTTVITWITVLILLAFTGKRRRGVVKDGKKITSEVAMYAANIVFKERGGVFAFTGTAIILGFTSMAVAWLGVLLILHFVGCIMNKYF